MKKIFNIKVSIIAMIVIPILSLMIGYFGVKNYLLSNNKFSDEITEVEIHVESGDVVISNDKAKEIESKEKIIVSFDELLFYSIQMGSFSDEKNAILFSDKLNADNIYSFYKKENNYIVYSFVGFSKESLKEKLELCKNEIEDSFIKKISIKGNDISYYADDNNSLKIILNDISIHFNNIISEEYDVEAENDRFIKIRENITILVADATENVLPDNKITMFLNELFSLKELYLNEEFTITDKYIVDFIKLYLKYYES